MSKVSIIVPIYKVEKFLGRCINSIVNQSYKNLEIILVDDGSPDKCGVMVDEYKKADSRIISLHKKNGGLSDARNYGMKYVTGEYVFFLDSDDYIELDTIEYLVENIKKNNADLAQCGFYYKYKNYLLYDNRYYDEDDDIVILNNNELMKKLVINEIVKNFAWGKLYKYELIKDLPFRKGVLFEDVYWAHIVMQRVNKYLILHKPKVYYEQRNDSISGNYNPKNTDILRGLYERHEFIENNYNKLVDESYRIIFNTSIIHYKLLSHNRDKTGATEYMKEIENYINNKHDKLLKAVSTNKELRNELRFFKINPKLCYMYIFYNKVLMKLGIKNRGKGLKRVNIYE